jgi:hypothetical protein
MERARRLALEATTGQPARRAERGQPEAGQRQRMPRDMRDRSEDLRPELRGITHERPEQPAPRPAVLPAETLRRGRHRPFEDRGAAAIERMRDRRVRMDQFDPMRGEIDRGEERGGAGQRHDRRADVVAEPGEGQFRGPGSATCRRGRLIDPDGAPGTGQRDRRGEAVRPGPDDDRIEPAVGGGRHGVG